MDTIRKIRRVLAVPDDYEVLLLGGGATLQFALLAYNFAGGGVSRTGGEAGRTGGRAADASASRPGGAYCVTGAWGQGALQSAQLATPHTPPHIAYHGEGHAYTRLPQWSELAIGDPLSYPYLHITSNETIHGLQFKQWPAAHTTPPLIADMSSDIMTKPIPVSRFAMLYAGAQKNIGIAGATVVVVQKAFLETASETLPPYLSYKKHAAAASLYSTPPTVSIFSINLVMDWIIDQGGVIEMNARNLEKANLLYSYIDEHSDFYRNPLPVADRSIISVLFTLPTDKLTERFLEMAQEQGMVGVRGHRSMGGCRVSLYNAVELRAVEQLIDCMDSFLKVV